MCRIGSLMLIRMSLITVTNNLTLIIEPYGTLLWIMAGLKRVPFVFTWMDLFERKFLIRGSVLPFNLILIRALMFFILGIES